MDNLHASAVAFDGRGILLIGPSGCGKSTLAIELIALGGTLVADDRVVAERRANGLWLDAPDPLRGMIEARGIGLLNTPSAPAFAALVVDLEVVERDRLPKSRTTVIAGEELPLLRKVESPAFAAMLRVTLDGERLE
ncbi:MAG: HPr kinase/phosphatase C-terminal domain-containing protein [Pseudomonadota bacterium]